VIGRRCLWTGHRGDFARHRHLFDVSDSSVDDIIVSTPEPSVDYQPAVAAVVAATVAKTAAAAAAAAADDDDDE